mmetsp:Transcript_90416/g.229903  ORF Transcript_90416/g.229903 Transcript_90416/m.229903 type:complete len:234 (-) Transcript_90416:63-764(-)|eukprot:CAMPEP_0183428658 /NCGR_PEP_ID=MMETSP0370-20130417/45317_1 /TAXON_ID=268820 /ORGANISM="Peridinium aciculiferum, Strain PAER-2" /LENGTH=233 /DNA_ID=CAMNT_0025613497 /DNA_START=54 /DNA_END=755 /DNA_ORIENTATION=-
MACQWLDLQLLQQGFQAQKKVQLLDGATVGDILKKVAQYKMVPVAQLFLTEARWTDRAHCLCRVGPSSAGAITGGAADAIPYFSSGPIQVKLHRNEVPEGEVSLGGVDDLDDLPDIITVEGKFVRTELTKAECLDLQDELIAAYSEDTVQTALEKLQIRFKANNMAQSKYPRLLADVLLAPQRKVLPKWGFDAPPKGVVQMLNAFVPHNDDPDVVLKVTILNGLIGLDMAWLS